MQVFQVNFGGGEPFLRDDFLDILEHAHEQGITTCVSTNGTVLDQDLVDELLCMTAPVYLQVSLDGAFAATNDAIRGAGTFDRILSGVELLAESRLSRPQPQHGRHPRERGRARRLPRARSRVRSQDAPLPLPPVRRRLRPLGGVPPQPRAAPRAERVPRGSPGDRHRRLVLRAGAGQPARAGAAHVRRGQDDLRHRARRQRLPVRLPVRPGVPRGQRHRWTRCPPSSPTVARARGVPRASRSRVAAGATASACATAGVRRSGTSSPTPSARRIRSVSAPPHWRWPRSCSSRTCSARSRSGG